MSYQLHLAIGDDLKDDVKAYADRYGISIAAAVRVLLRRALNGSDGGRLLGHELHLDDRVGA